MSKKEKLRSEKIRDILFRVKDDNKNNTVDNDFERCYNYDVLKDFEKDEIVEAMHCLQAIFEENMMNNEMYREIFESKKD